MMSKDQRFDERRAEDFLASYGALNARWKELCSRYLKVTCADSMWRYSRLSRKRDPAQGWKLHLPATVLMACEVLEAVAPALLARGVLFKAPRARCTPTSCMRDLKMKNSG